MIQIGFKSSKGIKRKNNEDACFVMPKEEVYIVADGVGGNNAGELASRTAVTSVAAYIKKNPIGEMFSEEQIGEYFKDCMEEANKKVYDLAEKYEVASSSLMIGVYTKDSFTKQDLVGLWYRLGNEGEYAQYLTGILDPFLRGEQS